MTFNRVSVLARRNFFSRVCLAPFYLSQLGDNLETHFILSTAAHACAYLSQVNEASQIHSSQHTLYLTRVGAQ